MLVKHILDNGDKTRYNTKKEVICVNILWSDRKRYLGMPISFTKYSVSDDRVFCQTGLFTLREEEVLLYRIRDISLVRTLGQRIFGVGTVCLVSSDKTAPHLELKNIKKSRETKELIYSLVEAAKDKRRMRATELLEDDPDGDGIDEDCDFE